jgi:hypothetical protein
MSSRVVSGWTREEHGDRFGYAGHETIKVGSDAPSDKLRSSGWIQSGAVSRSISRRVAVRVGVGSQVGHAAPFGDCRRSRPSTSSSAVESTQSTTSLMSLIGSGARLVGEAMFPPRERLVRPWCVVARVHVAEPRFPLRAAEVQDAIIAVS